MATTLEEDLELVSLARLQADIMQCDNLSITFGQREGHTCLGWGGLRQFCALAFWIDLIWTHQCNVRILPVTTRCRLITYYNIIGHRTWHIVHGYDELRVLGHSRKSNASKVRLMRILIAGNRLQYSAAIAIVAVRDAHVCHLSIVHHMQIGYKVILLRLRASASCHVRTATTLTRQHITVIIVGATRIAVAERATILGFRETKSLRLTLITVFARDETLAQTFASVHIAARIVDCAQRVAGTGFTTLWIVGIEIPETIFALIAATSLNIRFAVTGAGNDAIIGIIHRITDAFVQRATRIAITSLAYIGTAQILQGIAIEEGHTLLTMLTLRIVQTTIANTTRNMSRSDKDLLIEVATEGVSITLAFLARIRLLAKRWFPGQIIVEILASLAI